jgi:hypothetical protein
VFKPLHWHHYQEVNALFAADRRFKRHFRAAPPAAPAPACRGYPPVRPAAWQRAPVVGAGQAPPHAVG